MSVDVLLGLQWGDEGKGKIVDYIAPQYDIVARFQGGPNAGHTIIFNNKKIVLHTIPSGIFRDGIKNVIGPGVVVDPITLQKEILEIAKFGVSVKEALFLAKKAHLILPTHRMLDMASEFSKGKEKIGSTLKGIGPTYMDKTGRNGLRIGQILERDFLQSYNKLKEKHLGLLGMYGVELDFDLEGEEEKWFDSIEALKQYQLIDTPYFINGEMGKEKKILAEGAQGSMLDIDFGTYPYVTSSNTTTAGVCTGLGISPKSINRVIGISKAYCTRVGSGPFPSELFNETGELLQKHGHEFGATTGRPRRCGWIDLPQLKYSIMINGVTDIAMTKIDVLDHFDSIAAVVAYQLESGITSDIPYDLASVKDVQTEEFPGWDDPVEGVMRYGDIPSTAIEYIKALESKLACPISMISTGPDRDELIIR